MRSKFMKSSSVYKDNEGSATWSDTEGFYRRLHWLSTEAHASSNDNEDINDYFMCLEQFHIEIDGTIHKDEDREELEIIRNKILKGLLKGELDNKKLLYKRNILREYHLKLNGIAHKNGLFLKKSINKKLDHWNNNNKNVNPYWKQIKTEIQSDNSIKTINPITYINNLYSKENEIKK